VKIWSLGMFFLICISPVKVEVREIDLVFTNGPTFSGTEKIFSRDCRLVMALREFFQQRFSEEVVEHVAEDLNTFFSIKEMTDMSSDLWRVIKKYPQLHRAVLSVVVCLKAKEFSALRAKMFDLIYELEKNIYEVRDHKACDKMRDLLYDLYSAPKAQYEDDSCMYCQASYAHDVGFKQIFSKLTVDLDRVMNFDTVWSLFRDFLALDMESSFSVFDVVRIIRFDALLNTDVFKKHSADVLKRFHRIVLKLLLCVSQSRDCSPWAQSTFKKEDFKALLKVFSEEDRLFVLGCFHDILKHEKDDNSDAAECVSAEELNAVLMGSKESQAVVVTPKKGVRTRRRGRKSPSVHVLSISSQSVSPASQFSDSGIDFTEVVPFVLHPLEAEGFASRVAADNARLLSLVSENVSPLPGDLSDDEVVGLLDEFECARELMFLHRLIHGARAEAPCSLLKNQTQWKRYKCMSSLSCFLKMTSEQQIELVSDEFLMWAQLLEQRKKMFAAQGFICAGLQKNAKKIAALRGRLIEQLYVVSDTAWTVFCEKNGFSGVLKTVCREIIAVGSGSKPIATDTLHEKDPELFMRLVCASGLA